MVWREWDGRPSLGKKEEKGGGERHDGEEMRQMRGIRKGEGKRR